MDREANLDLDGGGSDSPIDTSPEVGDIDSGGGGGGSDDDSDSGGGDTGGADDPFGFNDPDPAPVDDDDSSGGNVGGGADTVSGVDDTNRTGDERDTATQNPADREDATANPGGSAGDEPSAGDGGATTPSGRDADEAADRQERLDQARAQIGEMFGSVGPRRAPNTDRERLSPAEASELSGAAGVNVGESRTQQFPDSRVAQATQRQAIRNQLEEQGADPENFNVSFEDGQPTLEREEQFGDFDFSFGLGGPEDEVEQAIDAFGPSVEDAVGERAEEGAFVEQFGVEARDAQTSRQQFLRDFSTDAAVGLAASPALIATDSFEAASEGGEAAAFVASGEGATGTEQALSDDLERQFGPSEPAQRLSELGDAGVQRGQRAVQFFQENPSELGGAAAVTAASAPLSFAVGSRLPVGGSDLSGRALAAASRSGRRLVRRGDGFLSDTRAQSDFGSVEVTREADAEAEAEASGNTFELVETEEGVLRPSTAADVEPETTSPRAEMDFVEAEARRRLPPEEEFPTDAEFQRELEGMMRRVEEQQRGGVESDAQRDTEQTQSAAAEGGDALEASAEAFLTNPAGVAGTAAAIGAFSGLDEATALDADVTTDDAFAIPAADTQTDLVTASDVTSDVFAGLDEAFDFDTTLDTDAATDTRTDTDTDLTTDIDTRTDTDTRQDTRFDTRLDTDTDLRLDLDARDRRDDESEVVRAAASEFGDVFRNPVIDPEEFLGGGGG
jgi:hypothetical protein